jgi:hypothetical protein
MENPHNLAKDAHHLIDAAALIVQQAVHERRALTETEASLVESLKSEAAPMLARATELRQLLRAAGIE